MYVYWLSCVTSLGPSIILNIGHSHPPTYPNSRHRTCQHGAIVVKNATVAGAEGGCQAECGVAAAMAAAAAVEMSGGTAPMAMQAFSLVLINVMGLVCDPIAGLVQVPCAQRNASQAVNAIICADMALAGMICVIPPDEVVEAMYKVGKQLPTELKETALGGIAATPTGKRIQKAIFGTESTN